MIMKVHIFKPRIHFYIREKIYVTVKSLSCNILFFFKFCVVMNHNNETLGEDEVEIVRDTRSLSVIQRLFSVLNVENTWLIIAGERKICFYFGQGCKITCGKDMKPPFLSFVLSTDILTNKGSLLAWLTKRVYEWVLWIKLHPHNHLTTQIVVTVQNCNMYCHPWQVLQVHINNNIDGDAV